MDRLHADAHALEATLREDKEAIRIATTKKKTSAPCRGLKEGIGFMPIDPMKSDENG